MVKPIHNMLKQNQVFSYNDTTEKDFVEIKNAISYASVLAKPIFAKDLIIYTNATKDTISTILLQRYDHNNEQPIAYMSQSLSKDEFKYTLIEKYTFVLVKVIETCCHFNIGKYTQLKVPLPAINCFFTNTLF
jgi:hypothetical protein